MAYLVIELPGGESRIEKSLSDETMEDLVNDEAAVFDIGKQTVTRFNSSGIPVPVDEG